MGPLARLVPVEETTGFCIPAQHREVDVVQTGHVQEQAQRLPVFGQISDARIEGLARRADDDRTAFKFDMAGGLRRRADDEMRQLRAARADQAGETDDLARTHGQGTALDALPVGDVDGRKHGSAPPRLRVVVFLVEGRDLASHHQPDDGVGADLRLVERPHQRAVAQHRDPIAKRIHFIHAMRDIDDGKTIGTQLADQGKQPLALAGRQRRRRLIHDQDLRPGVQRTRDLHQLALPHGQMGDQS